MTRPVGGMWVYRSHLSPTGRKIDQENGYLQISLLLGGQSDGLA
jgi:hypothetical protein